MNARSFFDTNILVYADDKRAPAKQSRAIDLVAEHRRGGRSKCFRNSMSSRPRWQTSGQRLISTGCMRFLFGMLWFCDRRGKLAVASYGPSIFRKAVKSMGFRFQVVNPFR